MSNQKWVRVTDVTPYVESEDFSPEQSAVLWRLYAPDGESYPLLFIGIYGDIKSYLDKTPITGIKISSSSKYKSREWWNESHDQSLIPLELLPDLLEMLDEIAKS